MFRGIVPSGIPSIVPSFSPDYPPCLFTKALPTATLPLPTRLLPTRVLMPPKRKTLPPPMSGASTRPILKVTCSFLCLPSFYPFMHAFIHPRFLLSFLSPCFPMSIGCARRLQVTCSFIHLPACLRSFYASMHTFFHVSWDCPFWYTFARSFVSP